MRLRDTSPHCSLFKFRGSYGSPSKYSTETRICFLLLILDTVARCQPSCPLSSHLRMTSKDPFAGHLLQRVLRSSMCRFGDRWKIRRPRGRLPCLLCSSFEVPLSAATGGTLVSVFAHTSQSRKIWRMLYMTNCKLNVKKVLLLALEVRGTFERKQQVDRGCYSYLLMNEHSTATCIFTLRIKQ